MNIVFDKELFGIDILIERHALRVRKIEIERPTAREIIVDVSKFSIHINQQEKAPVKRFRFATTLTVGILLSLALHPIMV